MWWCDVHRPKIFFLLKWIWVKHGVPHNVQKLMWRGFKRYPWSGKTITNRRPYCNWYHDNGPKWDAVDVYFFCECYGCLTKRWPKCTRMVPSHKKDIDVVVRRTQARNRARVAIDMEAVCGLAGHAEIYS